LRRAFDGLLGVRHTKIEKLGRIMAFLAAVSALAVPFAIWLWFNGVSWSFL